MCIYIYMCVCICVCVCVCIYIYIYIYIYIQKHTHTNSHRAWCFPTYDCVEICYYVEIIYMYVCVCFYIYIYTHTHRHIHTHIYIYIYDLYIIAYFNTIKGWTTPRYKGPIRNNTTNISRYCHLQLEIDSVVISHRI